jgi:hypothetical protein
MDPYACQFMVSMYDCLLPSPSGRVRGVPEDKVINEVMLADQPTKKVRREGAGGAMCS